MLRLGTELENDLDCGPPNKRTFETSAKGRESGVPVLSCPRCIPIQVPDTLSEELRRRAAEIVRGGSGIHAMKMLRDEASVSLVDAKAIVFHLARRRGHCQRCDGEIEPRELAYCPKCRSLTITW